MALIIVQFCSVHKIFLRVQVLAGATLAAAAAAAVAMAVDAAEAVQVVTVEAEVSLLSAPWLHYLKIAPQFLNFSLLRVSRRRVRRRWRRSRWWWWR